MAMRFECNWWRSVVLWLKEKNTTTLALNVTKTLSKLTIQFPKNHLYKLPFKPPINSLESVNPVNLAFTTHSHHILHHPHPDSSSPSTLPYVTILSQPIKPGHHRSQLSLLLRRGINPPGGSTPTAGAGMCVVCARLEPPLRGGITLGDGCDQWHGPTFPRKTPLELDHPDNLFFFGAIPCVVPGCVPAHTRSTPNPDDVPAKPGYTSLLGTGHASWASPFSSLV